MANQKYVMIGVGCGAMALVAVGAAAIGIAIGLGFGGKPEGATPSNTVESKPVTAGPTAEAPKTPKIAFPGTDPLPDVAIDAGHCDDMTQGGANDGCVTGTITCGQTIIGHTMGGVKRFDTEFYKKHFCTPNTTNHDSGDERIYRLEMPKGDWHAKVVLDSPCADLDLAAVHYPGKGCPTLDTPIDRCEMNPRKGKDREWVELVSQGESTWLIAVEGKDDEEGVFALQVICEKGLY